MTLPIGTRMPQIGDRIDVTAEGSDLIQTTQVVAIDEDTITLRMEATGTEHVLPLARALDLVWYSDAGQA